MSGRGLAITARSKVQVQQLERIVARGEETRENAQLLLQTVPSRHGRMVQARIFTSYAVTA